jgi:chorismate synthase
MAANSFGEILTLSSFGESHGMAMGGVLDGFPPNIAIDTDFIQSELKRRRPGQSAIVSQRNESDTLEILSGVFEGLSTGTPIAFMVKNKDQRSHDYSNIANVYRPSHADYTYHQKYGVADYRGGGRASARETLVRVAAGAFAKLLLKKFHIKIIAFTRSIGLIEMPFDIHKITSKMIEASLVRCPHKEKSQDMIAMLELLANQGDSIGGVVECKITGVPVGLGEPVYDKISARLAAAMMGINATKGFEIGSGFKGVSQTASMQNDLFIGKNSLIKTSSNNSGGIQGGISNGEDIVFRVAFKAPASISKSQKTVDKQGNEVELSVSGRHDPCVVPRAVPVVEAMAALVIADQYLRNSIYQEFNKSKIAKKI